MTDTRKRLFHLPEFKAKVGLEAVRGIKVIKEIAFNSCSKPTCSVVRGGENHCDLDADSRFAATVHRATVQRTLVKDEHVTRVG